VEDEDEEVTEEATANEAADEENAEEESSGDALTKSIATGLGATLVDWEGHEEQVGKE
jgi:hypothetical protein